MKERDDDSSLLLTEYVMRLNFSEIIKMKNDNTPADHTSEVKGHPENNGVSLFTGGTDGK